MSDSCQIRSEIWIRFKPEIYLCVCCERWCIVGRSLRSQDLGVGTDEVVALALLLGSDYTEGVRGVGIVNAMEVKGGVGGRVGGGGGGVPVRLPKFREFLFFTRKYI